MVDEQTTTVVVEMISEVRSLAGADSAVSFRRIGVGWEVTATNASGVVVGHAVGAEIGDALTMLVASLAARFKLVDRGLDCGLGVRFYKDTIGDEVAFQETLREILTRNLLDRVAA